MGNFAAILRESRLRMNLKQEDVAKLVGKTKNVVSNWERGDNKPDIDTLEILCRELEINPNDIITFTKNQEFKFSREEKFHIEKYRELDAHGKKMVDFALKEEWERSKEPKSNDAARLIQYYYLMASAGTGQIVFDNPPSELIEIPNIPKYRKANYAIGVNGDSMEPIFENKDILLIEVTNSIDIGEIGIFIVDGESYVKKLGTNELISLNRKYPNIPLNEYSKCLGRVIGTLE